MYSFQLKAETVTELHKKIINFAKELEGKKDPVSFEQMQEDGEDSYNQMPLKYTDAEPKQIEVDSPNWQDPKAVEESFKQEEKETPYIPAVAQDMSDLDSKGMPFDARIHASSRTKIKDGTWKYKRNLTEEVIAACEKQTHEKLGLVKQDRMIATNHGQPPQQIQMSGMVLVPEEIAPSFTPPPLPADMPSIPQVPPTTVHVTPPVFQVQQPAVQVSTPVYSDPVVPVVPTQEQARPAFDFASFKNNFVTFISSLIAQKKIDRPYILELCNYFQIADIWDITKDDTKCLELFNSCAAYGWLTKVG